MTHYDVLVVGSGFGGSVSALRLTEKGYRVGVLETGRRFADDEFAENSWHLREYPGGGYAVDTVRTGRWIRKGRRTFTADQVIFSAAALGTQQLLHSLRDRGVLPNISPRLGHLARTNSEAVLAARSRRKDTDFTKGVAITSSIHPNDHTHIEPVRYGKGSNAMSLLTTVMVDGQEGKRRWVLGLREIARRRRDLFFLHNPRRWSERMVGVLVMQNVDNSIVTYTKRGPWGRRMTTRPGTGQAPPAWIPEGNDVTRRIAEKIDGVAQGSWTELANIPITGHFIGGCAIGDSPETGVVDPYHRLYGYEGLHIVDGSTISANLGVNPSLTITAQAERAIALWPNKGEPDPRPSPGESYRRIAPVAPRFPVVPPTAPAALRLPIRPI